MYRYHKLDSVSHVSEKFGSSIDVDKDGSYLCSVCASVFFH